MKKQCKHYYFAGIGGSGMSALAQILRARGYRVSGSDRTHDSGGNQGLFKKLELQGIRLLPQQGSSITEDMDCLVVSSAIEASSPERAQALQLGIPVIHRAELLAGLFNTVTGIGIAGTSGKSTVTGMAGSIFDAAGRGATVINGGIVLQYVSAGQVGNARSGAGDLCLAELDESDGSIRHFSPSAGVITNISKDHKPLEELRGLFQQFIDNTSGPLIINADCLESVHLKAPGAITFGIARTAKYRARHIKGGPDGMRFQVNGADYAIRLPGRHNVANALAAIALACELGVPLKARQQGLQRFKGIQRRLQRIGTVDSVTVLDDFAHNPEKLRASLAAIKSMSKRMLIVFQPHGYGPTRFMCDDLVQAFDGAMRRRDVLIGLPIFDAGGTADRSISISDLLERIKGPRCIAAGSRTEALQQISRLVRDEDVIAVMGARDDSLTIFACSILRALRRQARLC